MAAMESNRWSTSVIEYIILMIEIHYRRYKIAKPWEREAFGPWQRQPKIPRLDLFPLSLGEGGLRAR